MTRKPRILVFSIPNDGHLNILRKMVYEYGSNYDFELILIDRKNSAPNLKDLNIPFHSLKSSKRFINTSADKVFGRAAALIPECLEIANVFKPDLIIYDFPAIEGNIIGKILNIPYWCSIPGMMGPFVHQNYLAKCLSSLTNTRALNKIEKNYGISFKHNDLEIISNCIHIPSQVNLLWSYKTVTPSNFLKNRSQKRYEFVGYLKSIYSPPKKKLNKPLIYISFGTEVMDNLWRTQPETRKGIRNLISNIATEWENQNVDVIFVTQGKKVLKSYPNNWTVLERVNQQLVLSRSSLFITHGGSNSFHEAVLFKVPMLAIPFFGDQPLVAYQAQKLNIGIDLVHDMGIEKTKPKNFLNENLVKNLILHSEVLLHTNKPRISYNKLNLNHTDLRTLFDNQFILLKNHINIHTYETSNILSFIQRYF